ncbi:MAG: hypothetical protein H0U90_03845 [Actinobacteria bacterium]|nr:hypothetical protein [Actinomycetota bacterium]
MTDQKRSEESGLTPEEIEAQQGETLPERELMSLINANVAIPIDAAIAANVLSDESIADADAAQDVDDEQSTGPQRP